MVWVSLRVPGCHEAVLQQFDVFERVRQDHVPVVEVRWPYHLQAAVFDLVSESLFEISMSVNEIGGMQRHFDDASGFGWSVNKDDDGCFWRKNIQDCYKK